MPVLAFVTPPWTDMMPTTELACPCKTLVRCTELMLPIGNRIKLRPRPQAVTAICNANLTNRSAFV